MILSLVDFIILNRKCLEYIQARSLQILLKIISEIFNNKIVQNKII